MGAKMAPIWPPVALLLMAGAGNWEQSKLDGYSVKPVSGLVSLSLFWGVLCWKTLLLPLLFCLFDPPCPLACITPTPSDWTSQSCSATCNTANEHMQCRMSPYRALYCWRFFSLSKCSSTTPYLSTNKSCELNKIQLEYVVSELIYELSWSDVFTQDSSLSVPFVCCLFNLS